MPASSRSCHAAFVKSFSLPSTIGLTFMNNRFRTATIGLSAFFLAGLAAAKDVTGAGASFPAPLYAKWAADYNKATGVKINYQSVGSGAGMRQIEAKTVDFG